MERQYCFGIDVGGTTIKCGLFSTDGTLMEKWEIPTRTENDGESILPDVAETVKAKMEERGLCREQVDGVGIGLPGPVNEKGEIPCAVNLHWGYKNVVKELSEMTGLPSQAANDANVAALGEAWMGAARGSRNVIMVTLGTGVGGGIIIDGRIVAGSHGAAGEIGHANVNHNETISCNCGNQGCLEQYTSATGIVRLATEELECCQDSSVLRKDSPVTAKDVLDAYKAGDGLAVRVMERFGDILGGALAVFSCVVDPDVMVIGGGVSKAGDPLIDVIQKYYVKYVFSPSKGTPIVLASLGNDAGIYGAAKLVIPQ